MKITSTGPIVSTLFALTFAVTVILASAEPTKAQWTSSGGNTTTSNNVVIENSVSGGVFGAYVKNTAGTLADTLSRFSVGQTNSEEAGLLLQFNHNTDNALIFNRKSTTGTLDLSTTGGGIRISNGGNVGIGTMTPNAKLDVNGSISIASGGLIATNGAAGSPISIYGSLADASGKQLTIKDGNVGIGTTSPNAKLDVNGSISIASGGLIATNGAAGSAISIYGSMADGSGKQLTIKDGNVGIGTTNPNVALDVVGSINLTGTINAKYQDVAEWVPSSEKLGAGAVVVLDSTRSNQVISSSVSYDTRVAGVVSEQPGIALGEKRDGRVLVATTGRVKVKVDASKGPIHIGDLLVTSDVPGVAMKSEAVNLGGVQIHRPGTLIGKALEPLEKGKGEILVLLSLQ